LTRTLPPGEYVSISVADEGSGMDDDTLRRAGDPFFTTKPGSVGSGLGLATCRAILTDAKGALLIQSKPDLGTTVTLLLPST
jgi:signal transduction histidine kinase